MRGQISIHSQREKSFRRFLWLGCRAVRSDCQKHTFRNNGCCRTLGTVSKEKYAWSKSFRSDVQFVCVYNIFWPAFWALWPLQAGKVVAEFVVLFIYVALSRDIRKRLLRQRNRSSIRPGSTTAFYYFHSQEAGQNRLSAHLKTCYKTSDPIKATRYTSAPPVS